MQSDWQEKFKPKEQDCQNYLKQLNQITIFMDPQFSLEILQIKYW